MGKVENLLERQEKIKKKNESNGKIVTEVENLRELVEREKASVTILLVAVSGHSAVDTDDVCMTMRDSHDRIEKMEKSLNRLERLMR